jgi:ankyrin repeat protein
LRFSNNLTSCPIDADKGRIEREEGFMNDLPARANLEHLRNEAKQLLKDLRRTTPDATLAAAQLKVARSYGFASWRKLKAYVDALHDSGPRLINAVQAGDLAAIGAVLDRCPELVDAPTDLGEQLRPSDSLTMRLIHLAVAQEDMRAARLLVERGANLNLRNAGGRLPLHDCFELGRDEFAQFLLASGAEADVCMAAGYGLYDRLREILNRDPEQANDLQTGILPVGWSVYGQKPESARILLEHGAIVDRPPYDVEAWGPATHVANIDITRMLLAHGASPNCRNKYGDTPMHAVIKSRLVVDPTAFVELLLAYGADRSIVNNDGRCAVDEALLQVGKMAETYFPARPIASKKLDRAIELLR